MDSDDGSSVVATPGWGTHTRTLSDSSSSTSSEQLALMDLAQRLYSVSSNNDPGIVDDIDVRNEAKLLMSLSSVLPSSVTIESGRITPQSDASSCHSVSSRQRDTFRFSCPSLSLESSFQGHVEGETPYLFTPSKSATESGPAALLGRVLKVEDVDALRLSSEAMARNIMQSYDKALQWRIQAWIDSLSRILVRKESELKRKGAATEDNLMILRESSEAMLIVRLQEIRQGIKVIDACNHFQVLSQKAPSPQDEPPHKRRRLSEDLTEGEYEYTVSHLLILKIDINLHAPAVGNASIHLDVPGTMNGIFVSIEDGRGQATDVVIDINTDILAAMIEKSSRAVVRATMEALLKGEENDSQEEGEEEPEETSLAVSEDAQEADPQHEDFQEDSHSPEDDESDEGSGQFKTPVRTLSVDRISELVFVTPRDCDPSGSSQGSDTEEHSSLFLSIPNDFRSEQPKQFLSPQSSLPCISSSLTIIKKKTERVAPSAVVTPSKSSHSYIEGSGDELNLPILAKAVLERHPN